MSATTANIGDGAMLLASGGVGAAVFRLAQVWLEKRAGRPSVAKDAADLISAAAVFQEHLHAAADGIVARMEARIAAQDDEIAALKKAHQVCEADARRIEGELNQQRQITESLARELRKAGIDVADLTGTRPLIVLHADCPPVEEKS